jgi:NADP-dependent 3-hydroxy acid dehydrogenase YdfG
MAGLLVVGAGPGIATSVARRFGAEGLLVALVARTESTLAAARDSMAAAGIGDVVTEVADAADPDQLSTAIDAIGELRGTPEVLVYNAGLIRADRPGELDQQGHLDAYAVNVLGALNVTAQVAPRMAAAGGGTVIFTGGMPEPVPEVTSLSLGKAGLRALTHLLDREYRAQGVHVATVTVGGAVAPGSSFDPDRIAEHYWRLHSQRPDRWETEVLFAGEAA